MVSISAHVVSSTGLLDSIACLSSTRIATPSSTFPFLCTPTTCSSGSRHPGGSVPMFDFATPLRVSRNLYVCSVVVHIRCFIVVHKPLVFHFRARCHNFLIFIVLLSSPGITKLFSILRVFFWRLAVSRFYQFSGIDTVFTHSLIHTDRPANA